MREVEKALEINKRIGLAGAWTRRVGVAQDSSSIKDIKNTRTVSRQSSILIGLDVGISSTGSTK